MSIREKPLTGGCQCGAVRYEIAEDPFAIYVCHCRECRKQSASAFGISLQVRRAGFRVTRGAPKTWSRAIDSTLDCRFCEDCGSRLWDEMAGDVSTVTVKGGSVDDPVDMRLAIHIWTARRLPGVIIPEDAEQHAGEPE